MIAYELAERFGELNHYQHAEALPVMLVLDDQWYEVVEVVYDEDRVLLNVEAR